MLRRRVPMEFRTFDKYINSGASMQLVERILFDTDVLDILAVKDGKCKLEDAFDHVRSRFDTRLFEDHPFYDHKVDDLTHVFYGDPVRGELKADVLVRDEMKRILREILDDLNGEDYQ